MTAVARDENLDSVVVRAFGEEWIRFDQSRLPRAELQAQFEAYFSLFPWERLSPTAVGFDVGCGSGRWAQFVAPRVGKLHCVEPSAALTVAERTLAGLANCEFHSAGVANLPFADASMDFGYGLGVFHHLPDPLAGIRACVAKLRPGAPLLVYLYYALDNRPRSYRWIWQVSDIGRRLVSRLPRPLRMAAADAIATLIYLPLARLAGLIEAAGGSVSSFPLASYRNRSYGWLRTDALDRFGTRLEQRFTRDQLESMLRAAGLEDVRIGDKPPYWCALGWRPVNPSSGTV